MGLDEYRRKRDFGKTNEPRGKALAKPHRTLTYLIQKHDASHLHYDFRLELNGVLKSWAVPKGPDLDPANKRLAMQVEDHPLEYGAFEGVIPQGQYGGGTVMLWDKGAWEPVGDPAKGLREGHLKFILHGEKLQGAWMLVRKGGRKAEAGERRWFLFKERDEFARPGESITEEMPLSVSTGRDLELTSRANPTASGDRRARSEKTAAREAGSPRTAKTATRLKRGRKSGSGGAAANGRIAAKASTRTQARRNGRAEQSTLQKLLEHPEVTTRPVAEVGTGRAGDACRGGAARRRLAARDQVRRLSHVVPTRQGQGSLHQPQRA